MKGYLAYRRKKKARDRSLYMKGCFREDNNFFSVFRGGKTNNELTLQEKIFLISIKEGVKEQKSERVVRESYGNFFERSGGTIPCQVRQGHN